MEGTMRRVLAVVELLDQMALEGLGRRNGARERKLGARGKLAQRLKF